MKLAARVSRLDAAVPTCACVKLAAPRLLIAVAGDPKILTRVLPGEMGAELLNWYACSSLNAGRKSW